MLQQYVGKLKTGGFDHKDTFPYMTVEDMAAMNIPIGVRRLLEQLKKELTK